MQVKSSHSSAIVPVLLVLAALAAIGLAQQAGVSPEGSKPAEDANTVSVPSFPCMAEITGNDVNIRSGPGTNYYRCGKLHKGDTIKIVSMESGWSRIVPPVGCFSWISLQCVSMSLDNPSIGILTGDGVQVYAGSDYVEPMHSTTQQGTLNRGHKVKLFGEEKDGYYKIVPPTGAYVWVSTAYVKPLSPIETTTPIAVVPVPDTESVVPTQLSVEVEMLKKYYALQKQIEGERAKPVAEQNYADVKKALIEIAKNKEAGKATRYAEFVVKQIEGFELALDAGKAVKLQNVELQQVMERIDKARTTRLAEVENLGRFAVIGQFQTFQTYGPQNYRIVDESGKTVCYALPTSQASQTDLSRFVKQKVGLVGTIEPHAPTKRALVRFTEILQLD